MHTLPVDADSDDLAGEVGLTVWDKVPTEFSSEIVPIDYVSLSKWVGDGEFDHAHAGTDDFPNLFYIAMFQNDF